MNRHSLQVQTVLDDALYQQILTECWNSLKEEQEGEMEQGKSTVVRVLVKLKLWKLLQGEEEYMSCDTTLHVDGRY